MSSNAEFTISSYPLTVPQEFDSAAGGGSGFGAGGFGTGGFGGSGTTQTLFGIIDGVNATFTTNVVFKKVRVYRNGQYLTQNVDFAAGSNVIVFFGLQIPQPGDNLSVVGYPA